MPCLAFYPYYGIIKLKTDGDGIMKLILRVFVSLLAIGALWSVTQHWFMLNDIATERGMVAVGAIGRANLRADVGGIFLSIGLFACIAAWRRSGSMALIAAALVGCALLGRFISAAFDGIDRITAGPIMIEIICLSIFLAAWKAWGNPARLA